jgi:membrane protein DedA with SNARE-associated domain
VLNHIIEMLNIWLSQIYATTSWFGIMIAMAIESCGIPLPSELVMPLGGALIAKKTILSNLDPNLAVFIIALAGAVGCLLGSMLAYFIGYKGGRPLILKYGRYVLLSQHDADKADAFFQRWGSATAFFSRLLPVVRTYISFPAGISKMPFVKFCLYSFLGSLPWCYFLAYAGYLLGPKIEQINSVFHGLDVVIAVAFVLLVAFYIWHHVSNDRKARRAHVAAEVEGAQPLSESEPTQV